MFTVSVVHWRPFKHNKGAGNGWQETLTGNVVQWRTYDHKNVDEMHLRASDHSKEEPKNIKDCKRR